MSKDAPPPQQTVQTNTTTFLPGQEDLINQITDLAGGLIGQDTSFPDINQVAAPGEDTVAGQDTLRDFATGGAETLSQNALDATQFGLFDVLFPESNPALQATIDAAIRPVNENFQEQVLPAISRGATAVGQSQGQGREDVITTNAIRDLNREVGDISSTIQTDAFNKGLDVFSNTLAALPSTLSTAAAPGTLQSQVGAQIDTQSQAEITALLNQLLFDQASPIANLSDIASIAFGAPTAGSVSTGLSPGAQTSGGLGSAIGGGLAGFAAGGPFGGLLGALGGFL